MSGDQSGPTIVSAYIETSKKELVGCAEEGGQSYT